MWFKNFFKNNLWYKQLKNFELFNHLSKRLFLKTFFFYVLSWLWPFNIFIYGYVFLMTNNKQDRLTKVNKASADWVVQIISSRLSFTKACNKQCFFHDSWKIMVKLLINEIFTTLHRVLISNLCILKQTHSTLRKKYLEIFHLPGDHTLPCTLTGHGPSDRYVKWRPHRRWKMVRCKV